MTNAFIAGIGPLELAIVLLIVLVLVGGRRLPALGRQLGRGDARVQGLGDEPRRTRSGTTTTSGRAEATAALGRPTGEETPVDGEVMRERS